MSFVGSLKRQESAKISGVSLPDTKYLHNAGAGGQRGGAGGMCLGMWGARTGGVLRNGSGNVQGNAEDMPLKGGGGLVMEGRVGGTGGLGVNGLQTTPVMRPHGGGGLFRCGSQPPRREGGGGVEILFRGFGGHC